MSIFAALLLTLAPLAPSRVYGDADWERIGVEDDRGNVRWIAGAGCGLVYGPTHRGNVHLLFSWNGEQGFSYAALRPPTPEELGE